MEKRIFKKIGRDVSLLGFGCMRLPKLDEEKNDIDWKRAEEMVELAYNSGVNYFDTAWMYHGGESEFFIGHALSKYPRESFMLADKMPVWLVKSPEDIDRIFEKQLEKCRVDYFDFYLLHALDKKGWANAKKHSVFERLNKFKSEGKIRHLGFSFHDGPEVLEDIASYTDWDFAQIQLNYLDWDDISAKRQYDILKEKNIPVIVMEPVRGGALATLNDQAEKVLRSAEPNMSNASWALRFAMSLDGVLTVLSGMSNNEHVEDNLKTVTNFKPLTESDYRVINEAATLYRKHGTIPCTGCKYCIDCPVGVNIPSIFSIYNNFAVTKNSINFTYCYKSLKEDEHADKCIDCGACVSKCPQHIEIPSLLKKIDAEIKSIKPR